MPLAAGLSSFAIELSQAYSDIGSEKSVAVFAKKRAQAIYTFLKLGMPMTLITFTGPAIGSGIGGIDKPVPGMGLDAALPILEEGLKAAWLNNLDPISTGLKEGQAIMAFMSQAKVLTIDMGALDPISFSGPSTGMGGIESPAPGSGLDSAKAILENELIRIWSQTKSEISRDQFAKEYAKAIYNFVKQGKIDTVGVISGMVGASVVGVLS